MPPWRRQERMLALATHSPSLQPFDQVRSLGAMGERRVEDGAGRILGREVEVGTAINQEFRTSALPARARVPKRLVDESLRGRGLRVQQCGEGVGVAEGGRVPQLLHPRPTGDEQPRDVPTAVSDRVVQRAADRAVLSLDIGAGVDQDPATSASSLLAAQCSGVSPEPSGPRASSSAPAAISISALRGPFGR
jgi:hypothetical protein